MDEEKSKAPLLPISGILILLAALGVTMFVQPFRGSRPAVSEHRESYEKINARLWQDPFSAILDSIKVDEQPRISGHFRIDGSEGKPLRFQYPEAVKAVKRITVLGVMVPCAPYTEETETRIRHRYAVLSGLSRVGFFPDDPEHIEFIKLLRAVPVNVSTRIPAPKKPYAGEKLTLSNIMPFELLSHTERNEAVLVVWINDAAFQANGKPLSNVKRFVDYLRIPGRPGQHKIEFKIIGPADSTGLNAIVKEAFGAKHSYQLRGEPEVTIYSPFATVDSAKLLKDSGFLGAGKSKKSGDEELNENAAREIVSKQIRKTHNVELRRTIGSDSELAKKLVDELRLRGIDLVDKNSHFFGRQKHLLLVAEWDTIYGRSFRRLLGDALMKNGTYDVEVDRRIHLISYMRGIDGSLPGEKEERQDEKSETRSETSSKVASPKDTKKLEQPVGKSQYDYLRRLAEETYRLDQDMQVRGAEIKAIGVMGTDFYDKFLVLQALRQRFPDVIFFTTDLDARFLHPDHIKWTRNLVVASNFGLSLRKDPEKDLQGAVPPFRDNYQTSIFFTILYAFHDQTCSDLSIRDSEHCIDEDTARLMTGPAVLPGPLIFEVGRTTAIDLTTDNNNAKSPIHPRRPNSYSFIRTHWLALPIIALLLPFLLFLLSSTCAENKWKVFGLEAALLLCVGAAMFCSQLEGEEPLSLFEGVSVWPTELLRVAAIALSILFFGISRRSLGENSRLIGKQFGYDSSGGREVPENRRQHAVLNRAKNAIPGLRTIFHWKSYTLLGWKSSKHGIEVPLRRIWAKYERYESTRYKRVVGATLLYVAICMAIVGLDTPVAPVRGGVSGKVDFFLVIFSVLPFALLIFDILDVTKCCRKFITIASEEVSKNFLSESQANMRDEVKKELGLIRLIAMRTEPVGKLVFYPFVVWLVMFLARLDYIDNWKTPIPLAVVVSMGALLTWSSAFLLRLSAEETRTGAINRLKEMLLLVLAVKPLNHDMVEYVESVIDEVKSIRQGAFLPIMEHPLVQALLVPFGGVGSVYLIDFFTKMNI